MSAPIKPIDLVLSLLPSLSEQEKQQVLEQLGVQLSPCVKAGHKYPPKPIEAPGGWFSRDRLVYVCSKCGHRLEMQR